LNSKQNRGPHEGGQRHQRFDSVKKEAINGCSELGGLVHAARARELLEVEFFPAS
jgi:hypothetical protein